MRTSTRGLHRSHPWATAKGPEMTPGTSPTEACGAGPGGRRLARFRSGQEARAARTGGTTQDRLGIQNLHQRKGPACRKPSSSEPGHRLLDGRLLAVSSYAIACGCGRTRPAELPAFSFVGFGEAWPRHQKQSLQQADQMPVRDEGPRPLSPAVAMEGHAQQHDGAGRWRPSRRARGQRSVPSSGNHSADRPLRAPGSCRPGHPKGGAPEAGKPQVWRSSGVATGMAAGSSRISEQA